MDQAKLKDIYLLYLATQESIICFAVDVTEVWKV